MKLRNMLKICLVFLKSESQYVAYVRYVYDKNIYSCNVASFQLVHPYVGLSVFVYNRDPSIMYLNVTH